MARRWQNQMVHKFHGKYSKTQTLSQSFQVWKMILNEKFSLNSSTVVYSQNEFSSIFRCALISSSKYSTHNFYYLYELFIFRFWNIRFVCEFLFEFIIWFHSAFNCQFTSWLHLFHFLWLPSPPPLSMLLQHPVCTQKLHVFCRFTVVAIVLPFDFSIFSPNPEHKRIRYCWCKSLSLWQNKLKMKKKHKEVCCFSFSHITNKIRIYQILSPWGGWILRLMWYLFPYAQNIEMLMGDERRRKLRHLKNVNSMCSI